MDPKRKAIELRSQFGDNAKYVVLEIMDEIKRCDFKDSVSYLNRLELWSKVKQELESKEETAEERLINLSSICIKDPMYGKKVIQLDEE